jgi:hypothetical protein
MEPMQPRDLRALMAALERRVQLVRPDSREVTFHEPDEQALLDEGLHPDGVRRLLAADWWSEMIDDVRETPAFCDQSDPPEQVLRYARDVVTEYLRKRFPLPPP